jgi:hypothetical protein
MSTPPSSASCNSRAPGLSAIYNYEGFINSSRG